MLRQTKPSGVREGMAALRLAMPPSAGGRFPCEMEQLNLPRPALCLPLAPGVSCIVMDLQRIEKAVREILVAVGEDPEREGLKDTPRRVARMYEEVFSGLQVDPAQYLQASFTEQYDELVVLRDIPFNSMCEHHLMPFEGKAHVAYIPDGKVCGLSKLARVVETFARRPQMQERLTSQIADLLVDKLGAKGVAVVVFAVHTCMTCRGVKKAGATMVTSAVRGRCRSDARTRSEVLALLHQ